MDATAQQDHQKLLSEVIKKQIVILGPDISLAKARNVPGLQVADDGSVTAINGNPAEITQKLVEQFMELSGQIVKKTMEPLLAGLPDGVVSAATNAATQTAQTATPPQLQPKTDQPLTEAQAPAQPVATPHITPTPQQATQPTSASSSPQSPQPNQQEQLTTEQKK